MIIQENGHWRSVRTPGEEEDILRDQIKSMTSDERACVEEVLRQYGKAGSSPIIEKASTYQWETVPVPIEQWLDDPSLSGDAAASLRPQLRTDMIELFKEPFFSNRYQEIVLTGSLGWGKTFFSSLAIMRICYELICLRCPQEVLGLSPSDPIYIIPVSRTKELARRVAFGQIAGKLNLSPFFRDHIRETKEEISFPDKRLFIMGGSSNESHALGMNVVCAFIDEGNFFGRGSRQGKRGNLAIHRQDEEEGYDKAQVVFAALARRIKSRFEKHGVSGMIFLVSSKRGLNDFTERRIRESMGSSQVFVRDYATWEVSPSSYVDSAWHRMSFSQSTGRSRYLEVGQEPSEGDVLVRFPEEFKPDFDRDPMGAAQDHGGVSFEAADVFISNREAIDRVFDDCEHGYPFRFAEWVTDQEVGVVWDEILGEPNKKGERAPLCCPDAVRHVHIDISKNHCATGFCVGHRAGTVEVYRRDLETGEKKIEEAPVIHIDFALRIVAPTSGEIDHQKVRGLVYLMIENGVNIRSVTMDRYCIVPNLQQFKKFGLHGEELSTVKKLDPYLYLRSAIYEGRVTCPDHPHLRTELRNLSPSHDGKKVDAGVGFTKDIADAMAGVVYYAGNKMSGGVALLPSKGESHAPVRRSGFVSGGDIKWADEKEARSWDGDDSLPSYIIT